MIFQPWAPKRDELWLNTDNGFSITLSANILRILRLENPTKSYTVVSFESGVDTCITETGGTALTLAGISLGQRGTVRLYFTTHEETT